MLLPIIELIQLRNYFLQRPQVLPNAGVRWSCFSTLPMELGPMMPKGWRDVNKETLATLARKRSSTVLGIRIEGVP